MVFRISTNSTLLRQFLQSKPHVPSPLAVQRRHRSSHSSRGQLLEVDLQMASSDGETEAVGVKKLGDMIHQIIVLKSTPDWLPFLPGSSFWVPPQTDCRSPSDVAQLMVQMANHGHNPPSGKNPFSLSTFQPRPFSPFIFQGAAHRHPSNMDVEEEEEVDHDELEAMLDEVEAEVEILQAQAKAEADARDQSEVEVEGQSEAESEGQSEAEAQSQAEAEAVAEAATEAEAEVVAAAAAESKNQVPTKSGKASRYENEEG